MPGFISAGGSLNDDEKLQSAKREAAAANDCQGTSAGKSWISSVEMGCLNNFPSPAQPWCARQAAGNNSSETRLLQDAIKQGVLPLSVMERPKQAANLRGELFFKLRWKRAQRRRGKKKKKAQLRQIEWAALPARIVVVGPAAHFQNEELDYVTAMLLINSSKLDYRVLICFHSVSPSYYICMIGEGGGKGEQSSPSWCTGSGVLLSVEQRSPGHKSAAVVFVFGVQLHLVVVTKEKKNSWKCHSYTMFNFDSEY